MSTKREVLEHLTRDELVTVVDRYSIDAPDRRAKVSSAPPSVSEKEMSMTTMT